MDLVFIIILLVAGMGLIILELVAVPGTTICGIAGVALTVWGLIEMYGGYGVFWGGLITAFDVVLCIGLLVWSLKTKTWKRFAQKEEIKSKVNELEIKVSVGDKGVTVTRLAPTGTALIGGERMEVFTSTNFVDPNTDIIVEQVEGNRIRVKPLQKQE